MAKSQRRKRFVWTETKELQLIEFYKKHRGLWDLKDGHNDSDVGEERLRELAIQLGGDIAPKTIRTKFKQLLDGYRRTSHHGLRSKRSTLQTNSKYYDKTLSFLCGSEDKNRKNDKRGRKSATHTREQGLKVRSVSKVEQQNPKAANGVETVVNTRIRLTRNSAKSKSRKSPNPESEQDQKQPGTSSQGNKEKNSTGKDSRKKRNVAIGPVDGMKSPRFVGLSTFARLPRLDEVDHCDVAIVGIPFDAGTSYRPGARFGPAAIRAGSRLLRPYNPGLHVAPFDTIQVADCGDIAANPFKIDEALAQITSAATSLVSTGSIPMVLGGDHTVALPMLRVVNAVHGPVALLHFDAHLDTWDTYFGAPHTHGTVFRRATEEGLLDLTRLTHVGIRGPLYSASDLKDDAELGFSIISTMDVADIGVKATSERIRRRIGDAPLYISVDIDVLDPAHAPGTGTPEAGGLTSRELIGILRDLAGCNIVGADLVEVSPAYDHAEVTALAAAQIVYELVSLIAVRHNLNAKS